MTTAEENPFRSPSMEINDISCSAESLPKLTLQAFPSAVVLQVVQSFVWVSCVDHADAKFCHCSCLLHM
jgi:hypothetical protein